MPITLLKCPHCEQDVELNLTSVTRSRDCPNCGKYIILQFTTKATRMKRKALLTPTKELDGPRQAPAQPMIHRSGPQVVTRATAPAQASPRPGRAEPLPPAEAYEPEPERVARTLPGSSGERFQHAPEIKHTGSRFFWGLLLVTIILGLVIAADRLNWWKDAAVAYDKARAYLTPATEAPKPVKLQDEPKRELPTSKEILSMPSEPLPKPLATAAVPAAAGQVVSEQEQAIRAVGAFLAAKDVEERLKYVRDRELIGEKMRKYYQTHEPGPIAYEKVEARETSPEGVLTFAFHVVLPGGTSRRVVAGRTAETGEYLVDWASFVLYGEMDWSELMEKRPTTPVLMRVLAEPGNYFNAYYPNDGSVTCLKLTNPLKPDSPPIYAYAERGKPLGAAVDFIQQKAGGAREGDPAAGTPTQGETARRYTPQQVILTLQYPPDTTPADANQAWVVDVVAEGWVARGF